MLFFSSVLFYPSCQNLVFHLKTFHLMLSPLLSLSYFFYLSSSLSPLLSLLFLISFLFSLSYFYSLSPISFLSPLLSLLFLFLPSSVFTTFIVYSISSVRRTTTTLCSNVIVFQRFLVS
uniref:Uncharacterized protein n=1 Tax=Cacopsylla melanoneura TaxID=428564 RepID=A0A8D8TL89_9HEMI